MKRIKWKYLAIAVALPFCIGLSACGGDDEDTADNTAENSSTGGSSGNSNLIKKIVRIQGESETKYDYKSTFEFTYDAQNRVTTIIHHYMQMYSDHSVRDDKSQYSYEYDSDKIYTTITTQSGANGKETTTRSIYLLNGQGYISDNCVYNADGFLTQYSDGSNTYTITYKNDNVVSVTYHIGKNKTEHPLSNFRSVNAYELNDANLDLTALFSSIPGPPPYTGLLGLTGKRCKNITAYQNIIRDSQGRLQELSNVLLGFTPIMNYIYYY